jgi:hypothetical protein
MEIKKTLNNDDRIKLEMAINRIHELASLENAKFCFSNEEDEKIKKAIKPYMMWFDCVAEGLEELLTGKQTEFYQFR